MAGLVAALLFLAGCVGYLIGTLTAPAPASSAVDIGFLQDMVDHHDQAVWLSALALGGSEDRFVRQAATEVIAFQRYEMGLMTALLAQRGEGRGESDRMTMIWMDHPPVPVVEMPGMASEAEIAELELLEGDDFDIRFLELLVRHHRGGLHMADIAADEAAAATVRELAAAMARNQRIEIAEYEAELARRASGS